jgi:hypothetical protein
MMSDKEPITTSAYKNVRRLDDGFVKTVGESGGYVFRTRDPAYITFDPDPN